jgi:dynein intermediate chain 2
VFYVARSDGVVDVWDITHSQNEVAYSHKVSDAALSSISIEGNTQGGGKLVAVGDVNGTVSMLEVCDSLAVQQMNEKSNVNAIFERETKREKNLEVRERDVKRVKAYEEERKRREEKEGDGTTNTSESDLIRHLEEEFLLLTSKETNAV